MDAKFSHSAPLCSKLCGKKVIIDHKENGLIERKKKTNRKAA